MILFKFENSKTFHICKKCEPDGFIESFCKRYKFFIGNDNIEKYDTNPNDEKNLCKICLKNYKKNESKKS